MTNLRIGHGYDVHRLVKDRKLILGGVEIPHTLGLLGHSDADVLLHAVMDSLLGALALGDIGKHFPDNSAEFKDISSMNLLTRVNALVKEKNAEVVNLDVTLLLQRPKVAPYIDRMRENISFALGIPKERISVKATTEEGLGFTGEEKGVAAHSIALLELNQ